MIFFYFFLIQNPNYFLVSNGNISITMYLKGLKVRYIGYILITMMRHVLFFRRFGP